MDHALYGSARSFCTFRFIFWHILLPAATLIPVLAALEISSMDVRITNAFYDGHVFLLPPNGWVEAWLHDATKEFTKAFAALMLLLFALSTVWPKLKSWRQDFLFVFLAMALGTSLVSLLKNVTNIHCPFELTLYGGTEPYLHLFDARIHGFSQGRCWPASHASCGFVFLSLYFVAKHRQPRLAIAALLSGLFTGFGYGAVRLLQGEHFFSHVLWSGLITWLVASLLAPLVYGEVVTRAADAFLHSRWVRRGDSAMPTLKR